MEYSNNGKESILPLVRHTAVHKQDNKLEKLSGSRDERT